LSQELERVYTINLGKVLLSPNNQRAKRAINMIKEYARHHMKNEEVKIEESLSHLIWKRGIKHPPRKIRVSMTKTDQGFVLVSPYEEEIEETTKPKEEKKTPEVEEKPEPESKEIETSESKEESAPKEPETKKPKTKSKESKSKKQKPETKKSKSKDSKKTKSKKSSAKKKSK
jgi:large subunit ribosomal protein L31e